MARHSHWHQIRLKKGATDVKRGKIFTRHARLIEMAARQSGGDVSTNPNLRSVIENARADNVPRDNIERAIKKGTGESKDAAIFEEIVYEGFIPGGAAIMVEVLTDNRNRAVQAVRAALLEYDGTLASSGAASFMFERKGELHVKPRGADSDADELDIIDAGADDLRFDGEEFTVFTPPHDAAEVRKKLLEKGFAVGAPRLTFIPTTTVDITDVDTAKKLLELMDAVEAEEEVTNVIANFELVQSVLEALEEQQ